VVVWRKSSSAAASAAESAQRCMSVRDMEIMPTSMANATMTSSKTIITALRTAIAPRRRPRAAWREMALDAGRRSDFRRGNENMVSLV
jgi:hypothetical protein